MVDESLINTNIGKLHEYFADSLSNYFIGDKPVDKYFEIAHCYNCGSNEVIGSFVINKFVHHRCKNCGMVYVSPRLNSEAVKELYNGDYYEEFYKIKIIPSVDYRRNVLAVNKFNQINKYYKNAGKVLDVGCGLGEVLSVFKENGWICQGIELNEFASNYAREKYGLKVINKDITDLDISDTYDVVMLWGVLEHLYNPIVVLEKVKYLLKDDGILVIEVPSADSVLVRYYEQSDNEYVDRILEGDIHIMLFSVRSLIEMLAKAGFKVWELKSNGLDIGTLNRLKLNKCLDLAQVNMLQQLLDNSLQGDLLRGYFKKERLKVIIP